MLEVSRNSYSSDGTFQTEISTNEILVELLKHEISYTEKKDASMPEIIQDVELERTSYPSFDEVV